ncbi:MAG: hypothetical protein IPP89_19700 [Saprospiraceae bacterium]|nr:hypothetical protein [Candidatus Brachybacter algidus]MBL0121118.1 hypothetical protein [Candidatus Brachybacter algidus]
MRDRDKKDTALFIYKTTISEANVGNVSYFKVYSGTIKTGDEITNAENGTVERLNHIFISNGKKSLRDSSTCSQ